MEAVVDACVSSERAMGWYYYLDGKMKVPFKARCRLARPINSRHGAGRGVRERNVVWVGRAGERIAVLLAQLLACRKIKRPRRPLVIGLWGERGYEL
jgi:hypothetical protein